MKPLGLISQIVTIGLALAIAVLFVQPKFAEIGQLQTEIQQYKLERERVTETNALLASKISTLESITPNDRDRLSVYMPVLVDELSILRDIENMAQSAGVEYESIQFNGQLIDDSEEARLSDVETEAGLVGHQFTVSVDGSYSRLKDFFSLLEQNHYPLQIATLDMTALESGFLMADATLVTYVSDITTNVE